MHSAARLWAIIGLLGVSAKGPDDEAPYHDLHYETSSCSTTAIELPTSYDTYPTESVTTIPTTLDTTTTVSYPITCDQTTITISVPETIVPNATTVTIKETVTHNSTLYFPSYITTVTTVTISIPETIIRNSTFYYPTVVPTTKISTVPTTIVTTVPTTEVTTEIDTEVTTKVTTEIDTEVITKVTTEIDTEVTTEVTTEIDTEVTTTTVPTTITSPVPTTITSPVTLTETVDNECPTTCSVTAGTVRLFFWPTDNDYAYPSTYVDEKLDYTFTSPSVYLVINTIYGTNSLGRVGPSGTSEVFAADLNEISTIFPDGQITRQLTLNDLYTNCPQAIDPAIIATTIPDGHCDFSLLAPETVKQWASPCGACGRLGLFDPPYAIPTLSGGLIVTTITTTTDVDSTTLSSTITSPTTGPTTTVIPATTTTTAITTSITPTSGTGATSSGATSSGDTSSGDTSPGDTSSSSSPPSSTISQTAVPTASASKIAGACGASWLLVSLVMIFWL